MLYTETYKGFFFTQNKINKSMCDWLFCIKSFSIVVFRYLLWKSFRATENLRKAIWYPKAHLCLSQPFTCSNKRSHPQKSPSLFPGWSRLQHHYTTTTTQDSPLTASLSEPLRNNAKRIRSHCRFCAEPRKLVWPVCWWQKATSTWHTATEENLGQSVKGYSLSLMVEINSVYSYLWVRQQ